MSGKLAVIFGGSGFIGRYLVQKLAQRGWRLRVAVRRPDSALFLKPMGDVGQIQPVAANLRDEASVKAALVGADAAVNLVGLLYERGKQSFDAVHVEGAQRVARLAAASGVKRLIHLSAIGADPQSPANYARSKAAGEAAVSRDFPLATILRPSIVIGPEDDFFNRFAAMARLAPALPLIGGGQTKFQPIYVGDLAEAMARCLERPTSAGKIYEIGGPRIYSFRQLLELMLKEIGRRRLLLPLPFWAMQLPAAAMSLLPVPPLTMDQLRLLRRDNVVGAGVAGLADLDLQPTAIEAVIPSYLKRYRPGGRHADMAF
jgi:uncharacterized protein YbjT (DUF2867 family)